MQRGLESWQAMDETTLEFDKIYEDFHARVQRYLSRLVGEDEAEDLTQIVFIRVSQNLNTFRGESQLSTWIFRIATNAAYDRMRESSFREKRRTLPLEDANNEEIETANPHILTSEPAQELEQQIHQKQGEACYCEMLNHLPEHYRVVVMLSEIEGLCAKEIADILGLSVDVVKIRLHRGREKLLQALKVHCRREDWL